MSVDYFEYLDHYGIKVRDPAKYGHKLKARPLGKFRRSKQRPRNKDHFAAPSYGLRGARL